MTATTFFLVRLQPDLTTAQRNATLYGIRLHPLVESVTVLNAVSQDTLTAILRAPPAPVVETLDEPVDLFSFAGVDVA